MRTALISIPARGPRRTSPFVRAAFARAQSHIRDEPIHKHLAKDDAKAMAVINRATIAPATTTGAGWAVELTQTAFGEFLVDLAPYSAAANIIAQAVQANLGPSVEKKYPTRAAGATPPQWVGENDAIPVAIADFSQITIGPKRKLASIIVWSVELSKRSDADSIFESMLREDMAAGLDAGFFADTVGSASAHEGLLYGLTPIASFGGGDEIALKTDLVALADAVATGGSGAVTFVVAPQRLARLKIIAPEIFAQNDFVPSAALADSRVIAVDPASILAAVDPTPDIYVSTQATIHMNSTPLEIVDDSAVVADPVRSAWQTSSMAFRCIYEMAWAKRRSAAVAYLDDPSW